MGSCFFNNVLFLSYFLILTPSVAGFAEIPRTLVRELSFHVGINFKSLLTQFAWLSDGPLQCNILATPLVMVTRFVCVLSTLFSPYLSLYFIVLKKDMHFTTHDHI